jgi:signal transduction histidine kinase
VIERHGGTLSLKSRVGEGTIATVMLPAGDHETVGSSSPRAFVP